jgi:hypothetical protein
MPLWLCSEDARGSCRPQEPLCGGKARVPALDRREQIVSLAKIMKGSKGTITLPSGVFVIGRLSSSVPVAQSIKRVHICLGCGYSASSDPEFDVHRLLCVEAEALNDFSSMAETFKREYASHFPEDMHLDVDLDLLAVKRFGLSRKPGETDAELRFRLKQIILTQPKP